MKFPNGIKYVVGEMVNKCIPFAFLPILTRYLEPKEYSILESYFIFMTFYQMLVWFNQNTIYAKRFNKDGCQNLLSIFFVPLLIFSLSLPFFYLVALYVFGFNWHVFIFMSFNVLFQLLFAVIQIENQFKSYVSRYVFNQLIFSLLNFVVSFCFLVQGFGADGRLFGIVSSAVLFSSYLLLFRWVRKSEYLMVSKYDGGLKYKFLFGLKLLPYNLINGWLKDNVSKILVLFFSLESGVLGIYSVTFVYASVFVFFFNSLMVYYSPKIYSSSGFVKTVRIFKEYSVFSLGTFFFTSPFFYYLFPYIVGEEYSGFSKGLLVFWVAFIISSGVNFFNVCIISSGKEFLLSLNSFVCISIYFAVFLLFKGFFEVVWVVAFSYLFSCVINAVLVCFELKRIVRLF